ncbi:MAG: MraY family glycosyltransferase [Bacteroidales bacterium]
MNIIILGIVVSLSTICSFFCFKFLLHNNNIFQILKKKNVNSERWASQSKPIFGGIVFYISFLIAFITALISIDFHNSTNYYIFALLACVSLSFFMGLLDDLQNQGPLKKFLVQIICATILIYCNVYIETSDNIIINYLLTYAWVIGIMNSINMLDNMDAITGSVSTIILLSIFSIILFTSQHMLDLLIIGAIIPSLIVYLFWNWHPSKMYMGDNGSQFLGIILAIYSIQYIWNAPSIIGINYESFILIGLSFLLPLIDTTIVFVNRLAKGKSPFIGDKYHTTHNLVYLGFSEKSVARLFIAISLVTNAIVFYIIACTTISIHINYYLIFLLFIGIVLVSFYIISQIVKPK